MAWTGGNYYLSYSEMRGNVAEIWNILGADGWTRNAVAAICGNMQAESTINPGIWEGLTPTSTPNVSVGYGLVQWTPWNKYADWAGSGWQNNGPKEVARIQYEVANNIQWFENGSASSIGLPYYPPITFAQFAVSTISVSTLSDYFIAYYEHPASLTATYQQRRSNSLNWYDYLLELPDPGPTPPTPTQRDKMPVWMMCRHPRLR